MYQCPMCGAWFWTVEELMAHGAVCPVLHPELYCPTCGAGPFSSQAERDAHMAAAHPPPPQYYCPYCGAPFYDPVEFDYHVATCPARPQPYTKRVSVTVQNTSSRGGEGTLATLEVTVGARIRGIERIGPFVSSMTFWPGVTWSLLFDIVIEVQDFGSLMTVDALVARPEGGIIASETKSEVV